MSEVDVTVFLPSIRVHNLERWYDSLKKSISRHTFNVVVAGPFDAKINDDFHWIETFRNPVASAQMAALESTGKLLFHVVDDTIFYPDVISNEIDRFYQSDEYQITGMGYREGINFSGETMPPHYFTAKNDYPGWSKIGQGWVHCCHFLMPRDLFIKAGGFDCRFHYLTHACHDLIFRLHYMGYKSRLCESDISTNNWYPGRSGDHGPVNDAQVFHDTPIFAEKWKNSVPELVVDIDAWKQQPEVWRIRFTGEEKGYNDLKLNKFIEK